MLTASYAYYDAVICICIAVVYRFIVDAQCSFSDVHRLRQNPKIGYTHRIDYVGVPLSFAAVKPAYI